MEERCHVTWLPGQVDPGVSLAEFYVVGYRQRFELEELTSGNYSRLCADILFSRSMGYYIIQVYVPSSLIVVMSWLRECFKNSCFVS